MPMQRAYTDAKTGETIVIDLTPEEEAALLARRAAQEQERLLVNSKVVSPRQAKLALHGAGLLDQVEAAVAAADKATQITWEYAIEFRRDDPLIDSIGKGLGLTDEQIDQLFISASQL